MKLLEGKIALITGGSRGIGEALVRKFTEQGAKVAFTYVSAGSAAKAEALAAELGGSTKAYQSDAGNYTQAEALISQVVADFGKLDIVVNNAGSTQPAFAGGLQNIADVWESTIRGNLMSAVLVTEALLPQMTSPGGRIFITGSFAAQFGTGSIAYSAAKAALQTYVVSLTRTQGPRGITCNVVAPGYTGDTELVAGRISEERHARLIGGIAVGRAATSQEIANVINFVASDGASFVTGQTITANGGVMFPG